MMQIEDTFFDLANTCEQNCLLICDRGLMDASACTYNVKVSKDNMGVKSSWDKIPNLINC